MLELAVLWNLVRNSGSEVHEGLIAQVCYQLINIYVSVIYNFYKMFHKPEGTVDSFLGAPSL